MENKIVNKQIPIKSIIDVANYFNDYKNRYDNIFLLEKEKNKDVEFSNRKYEYEGGSAKLEYTINLKNGKSMTEIDYDWFIKQLDSPSTIEAITLYLRIDFYNKSGKETYCDQSNKIIASIEFNDSKQLQRSDIYINVDTTNQEQEANIIYSKIKEILENNEERYNKTIKYRKIRIQSFCISVGMILSYILYFVLTMNRDKIPVGVEAYLTNKYAIVFGQWILAMLFGNLFSYWYILYIYKPLLPDTKYVGYNSNTNKSVYKDDLEDYLEHSEVHFGKYWDAGKRRIKIEKIYKITSKIIIVQLVVSMILFLVLK